MRFLIISLKILNIILKINKKATCILFGDLFIKQYKNEYYMKMIVHESEVQNLIGKFIITINNDNPSIDITEDKGDGGVHWLQNRIRFISCNSDGKITTNCLTSITETPKSPEEFVRWFNAFDKNRHRRLLTRKELLWLFTKLIENNY